MMCQIAEGPVLIQIVTNGTDHRTAVPSRYPVILTITATSGYLHDIGSILMRVVPIQFP